MLQKYSAPFLAIAILLTGSLLTFAQTTQPVRGKVEIKKADGTMAPVEGLSVETYQTDVKRKGPTAKTNKKGEFNFAGLPLGGTFVLAISGPGIKAELYPGVKAGAEDLKITVSEGDGKALTEDEVRGALSTAPKQGGGVGQPSAADVEAAKKAKEEYEKQVKEVTEKNKKVEDTNKLVNTVLQEGNKAIAEGMKFKEAGDAALSAKKTSDAATQFTSASNSFTLAATKYQEGIAADPDFAGSATVLNNNKAVALQNRGLLDYKQGVIDSANKMSWLEKAKQDFSDSIAAAKRTLELVSKETDPAEAKKYEPNKNQAISLLVETYRLLVHTGADASETSAKEAVVALDQYLAMETDSAKKVKAQILIATAIRTKVGSAMAIPIYKAVLEVEPNNADAMGNLGLCMFDAGVTANNKEQMQEGLNLMQKFAETAPDKPGDQEYAEFKQSVADSVKYLKEQEKMTPQKIKTTTPAKGKKP